MTRLPVGGRPTNFLEEVTVDDSLDAPVAQARVRLRRQVELASLSPLMETSPLNRLGGAYEPLIRSGRLLVVDVAVCPLGMEPSAADWLEVFRGRMDTPRDSGEFIEFPARDYSALLQDAMIEVERTYSTDAGTPVQWVQQAILDDNRPVIQSVLTAHGMPAFALYIPDDPEWDVGRFIQKKEAVLEALRALAGQLGADVKYRWRHVASAFALWLYTPDREATAPVWTYGPGAGGYTALPDVELPWEDVRTAATGYYFDKSDKDAAGNPKKKRVDRQADAATLAAYGRRWMEFALGGTDNIDTEAEMIRFLDIALSDLAQPPLGVAVEVPLHPGLELGDVLRLKANGIQYSADQTAAVYQWTLTYSRDVATTRLVLRGKPALAPRVWLAKEAGRPGLAKATPFTGPSAPTVLSVSSVVDGVAIEVAPATSGPATADYEVHASTTSGFTPDSSNPSSTLKTSARSTRLELTGALPAGQTSYVRVVPRDAAGNRGEASAQYAVSPGTVQMRHLQPFVNPGAIPPNGDFEAQNGSGPPDTWTFEGVWGADAQVDNTTSYSGLSCILFPSAGNWVPYMVSQAWTARGGDIWELNVFHSQGVLAANALMVQVEYLRRDFVVVGVSTFNIGSVALQVNRFYRSKLEVTVPNVGGATASYMRVRFRRLPDGGSVRVDSLDFWRKGSI
ncbi:hypothetical protein F0U59_23395 [Archangium gephyra]|nr:hypothetical protein F0U59_23395 [Archangium gephyra]